MGAPKPTPRLVMWAAIALSAVLAGALVAYGWDDRDAWATAAAMLGLACIAVCVWAAAQGRVADREVRRAVARLAADRRTTLDHAARPPEAASNPQTRSVARTDVSDRPVGARSGHQDDDTGGGSPWIRNEHSRSS